EFAADTLTIDVESIARAGDEQPVETVQMPALAQTQQRVAVRAGDKIGAFGSARDHHAAGEIGLHLDMPSMQAVIFDRTRRRQAEKQRVSRTGGGINGKGDRTLCVVVQLESHVKR